MCLRRFLPILLAGAALLGGFLDLKAQEVSDPPEVQNVRYTENYGYLRAADPEMAEALWPWAPLKYIPLLEGGDIYLTLGAEFRLRYELFRNENWGEGPQDDDGYLWARALPLADLHIGENVRFFGQLVMAQVYGLDRPASPVDENRLDLLQAFVDLRASLGGEEAILTLRPGRQLMTYGSGRLIDVRYGPNVLQSFDAAKLFLETNDWRLDTFYARPVDHRAGEFDDRTDDRQAIWAVYGTYDPSGAPAGLDVYYIGYLNRDAVFSESAGRERRHTLGARLFGEARGWDWDYELFYQFGQFGRGNISAWSAASDTGYTFDGPSLHPRLALKANIISGDRDPADTDVETFNPLFPKGKYFGELTPIGPSNLIHINPYITVQLTEKLQCSANLGFYWRQSTDDGLYQLGNMNLLRSDEGSESRYIGTQTELLLEYRSSRHFSLATSYSVFTAGPFIRDTGAHEAIQFVALELLYRF